MPAYRSSAEAQIRDAVVERLRKMRPGARIIHEINVCQGGNRIDVLAVDRAEMIAAEIKSERDKLDRLKDQAHAMRAVAHHVILALHEKFCPVSHNGMRETPSGMWWAETWVWPEPDSRYYRWRDLRPAITQALPETALDMLWAAELREVCATLGVPANSRTTRPAMMAALRWNCTGAQITRAICAALRARSCVEADPAIPIGAMESPA